MKITVGYDGIKWKVAVDGKGAQYTFDSTTFYKGSGYPATKESRDELASALADVMGKAEEFIEHLYRERL